MNLSEAMITGKGVTLSEALSVGGLTTGMGLAIVFGVLVVLMIVLYLFKVIFYKDPVKTAAKVQNTPAVETAKPEEETAEDTDELIAVITAAVAASLNTSTYNLQIKSIRRVDDKRPSWNKAGLRETIDNRF